jgi:hypothetical protein
LTPFSTSKLPKRLYRFWTLTIGSVMGKFSGLRTKD